MVFQPHRYTRTKDLFDDFKRAFYQSDILFVLPIYSAGEITLEGVNSESLCEAIISHGHRDVFYIENADLAVARLKEILKEVQSFLAEKLKLNLNYKSTFLNSRLNGLPFLGFRVFPNLIRVKRGNLKRAKKRLEKKRRAFQSGTITEEHFVMSVRSMFDHVGFADSFRLRSDFLVPRAGMVG